MPDLSLAKKLQIKAGHRLLVLDAPDGYVDALGAPVGGELAHRAKGLYDVVQLFVSTRAAAKKRTPVAVKALRPGGVLWICWPKQSSKITTDLNRDILYRDMQDVGLQAVSNVSIDATWSALRLKRV
jgi:hypothetical protein